MQFKVLVMTYEAFHGFIYRTIFLQLRFSRIIKNFYYYYQKDLQNNAILYDLRNVWIQFPCYLVNMRVGQVHLIYSRLRKTDISLTLDSYHASTSLRFPSIIDSYLHLISSRIFLRSGPGQAFTSTLTSPEAWFFRQVTSYSKKRKYLAFGHFFSFSSHLNRSELSNNLVNWNWWNYKRQIDFKEASFIASGAVAVPLFKTCWWHWWCKWKEESTDNFSRSILLFSWNISFSDWKGI